MSQMTFHLAEFDGPLDLLLHLIARNKVSIYDIPIASILAQYMEILHRTQNLDLDASGDFIAMAAQLVYIKSRMLLPKPDHETAEDPRTELVEQLIEYQRMKEMTPYFREHMDLGRDRITKPPEPQETAAPLEYHHIPAELVRAAHVILERIQRRTPPPASAFRGIVGREVVPVHVQITAIHKRLVRERRLRFLSLFEHAESRSEVVATFLAVLELSKTRRILMTGEGDEIELTLAEGEESA
ncbi:MAG: segregation and condensation protein A [Butyricicoccus sp.]|nr:segregation/condensation protein A [Butyricicoccus pullicaecorum]